MANLLGLRMRLETNEGLFLYEFGTHLKHVGKNNNIKINLSESKILELKEKIKNELQVLLDNLEA